MKISRSQLMAGAAGAAGAVLVVGGGALWRHLSQSPEQRILSAAIETVQREGGRCSDSNNTIIRTDGHSVNWEENKNFSMLDGNSSLPVAELQTVVVSQAEFDSKSPSGVSAQAELKPRVLALDTERLSETQQYEAAIALARGADSYHAGRTQKEVLASIATAVSQVCSNQDIQPLPNSPRPSSQGLVTLGFFEQGGRING